MTARNGWLLAVTLGALSGVGCSHTPVGYRVPGKGLESVTVLTEHDAVTTGLPAWSLAMPLGAEEDASVLKFLEQAEASGAKYLTDVAVVFAAEDNGQPLECRTHFLPVMAVEKRKAVGAVSTRWLMNSAPVRPLPSAASSFPLAGEQPYRYVTEPVSLEDEQVRRWRLLRSEPECKPLEGSAPAKVAARVEGRVYGCHGTSNCQDKTL
jgi:hypothetical protein